MSRDAATVRADAPKISNSEDTATISAIAETASACSRSNSRDSRDANSTNKIGISGVDSCSRIKNSTDANSRMPETVPASAGMSTKEQKYHRQER